MLLSYGVWEDSLRVPWTARKSNQSILKYISPGCSLEGWWWSWNSNILASWCKELTHWNKSLCWERLRAVGEGDGIGWDGWMALPTQWTRVWVDSSSWWWTGRPGVLQFMGSQRVIHDWVTELNWNVLRIALLSKMWPILRNILCVIVGKKKCILLFLDCMSLDIN